MQFLVSNSKSFLFNFQVSASDLGGIAPRLDSMDIDALGESFDTRDTDSEDEGIKEGRKKKRQVAIIFSCLLQFLFKIDYSRRSQRSEEWQCTSY